MEASYGNERFPGEYCVSSQGWNQPNYNTSDLAYLPYSVVEQNDVFNNSSHIQQNQYINNWGYGAQFSSFETFSMY